MGNMDLTEKKLQIKLLRLTGELEKFGVLTAEMDCSCIYRTQT